MNDAREMMFMLTKVIHYCCNIYHSTNINLLNDNFYLVLLIYISRMKSDYV